MEKKDLLATDSEANAQGRQDSLPIGLQDANVADHAFVDFGVICQRPLHPKQRVVNFLDVSEFSKLAIELFCFDDPVLHRLEPAVLSR